MKLLASRASRVGGLRAQAETEVQGQSTTAYSCRGARLVKPTRGLRNKIARLVCRALLKPALHGCPLEPHVPAKPHARHRTRQHRLTDPGHRHRQQLGHLVRSQQPVRHAVPDVGSELSAALPATPSTKGAHRARHVSRPLPIPGPDVLELLRLVNDPDWSNASADRVRNGARILALSLEIEERDSILRALGTTPPAPRSPNFAGPPRRTRRPGARRARPKVDPLVGPLLPPPQTLRGTQRVEGVATGEPSSTDFDECAGGGGMPGSALGEIVPSACIAGVGLWDSRERVAGEWGPPDPANHARPRSSLALPEPHGHSLPLARATQARPVGCARRVSTTAPRDRLLGIGVGSWRSEVHAATAQAGRRPPERGAVHLTLAHTLRGGERETYVTFKRNRVTKLGVSVYSDFDDGPLQYVDKRCRSN